ncbi:MHO_1580 family protein [Metamycoplasma gateae]|uniref:Uncharacterized protein n=1 Tax=Metamycoplasma gateae TaxID=35769 RepID=A0ABZ2AI58_9BACT|nr:hypothetical protein V2E26_01095 [Metamycoplasma gateae]
MIAIYNEATNVIKNKKIIEYNEKVSAKISRQKTVKNKLLDFGLEKNEKFNVEIIRNFNNNTWVIEFTIPKRAYDNSKYKEIELNKKRLKIEDIEEISDTELRFRTNKFIDGLPIKFLDLGTLDFNFYWKIRKEYFNKLAFKININILKNNIDTKKINAMEHNLKFNFVESINFSIEENLKDDVNPFETNIGYYNNLIYNINFNNMKQNTFFYKALEQNIELKSKNRYYVPNKQYQFSFLDKVIVNEGDKEMFIPIITEINYLNKFKSKINYYVDRNNKWLKDKKEFIETSENTLRGYHIPPKFNGNIKLKYQIKQKLIDGLDFIKYEENFSKKLFDNEDGIIKLECLALKTNNDFEELNYSNWTKKIL